MHSWRMSMAVSTLALHGNAAATLGIDGAAQLAKLRNLCGAILTGAAC